MKKAITIIIAVLFAISSNAQIETISSTIAVFEEENIEKRINQIDAFGEIIEVPASGKNKGNDPLIPGFHRTAKPLAADFSGYSIQLVTSSRELVKENELYQEFGSVMVEEMLNPKFAYLVGQFKTLEGAEKYKNTVIGERYSDAVVVNYTNGKRTNK